MQQLFIINPAAGKTDASVVLVPQIQAAAARAGVDVQIEVTRSRGHARQLAEAAAASEEEVHIYAAGGDGTMNEVLQGAANHPNIAVGCIPCGSGNDYVRNFGAPADFLDMDAQLAAETFPVGMTRWAARSTRTAKPKSRPSAPRTCAPSALQRAMRWSTAPARWRPLPSVPPCGSMVP